MDVELTGDGTVTVTVRDPLVGDLKVSGCVVVETSDEPEALPRSLRERLAGELNAPDGVSLGRFSPAVTMASDEGFKILLPDGRTADVPGEDLWAEIALSDGRVCVVTKDGPAYLASLMDSRSGRVETRKVFTAVVTSLHSPLEAMGLSVVLLIPEKNAMRVVFPYPETIFLTRRWRRRRR